MIQLFPSPFPPFPVPRSLRYVLNYLCSTPDSETSSTTGSATSSTTGSATGSAAGSAAGDGRHGHPPDMSSSDLHGGTKTWEGGTFIVMPPPSWAPEGEGKPLTTTGQGGATVRYTVKGLSSGSTSKRCVEEMWLK